jgi:transcriptional regulator with XRE-family HTH domain
MEALSGHCRGQTGAANPKSAYRDEEQGMHTNTQAKPPMTPTELGFLVKNRRDAMKWSQEALADLSGLTVRTIQRVEAGQPSSLDTRRAIARGFQIPDLDVFSKPNPFPTAEELEQQKAEFDRQYLVLDASVVNGRKIMAMLIDWQGHGAISPGGSSELPHAAQDAFAGIVDYVRDCMDVANVASRREMLGYGDEIDTMIADLHAAGFCLCMAERHTSITKKSWVNQTPMKLDVAYLVSAPIDSPPAKVAVSRSLGSWAL